MFATRSTGLGAAVTVEQRKVEIARSASAHDCFMPASLGNVATTGNSFTRQVVCPGAIQGNAAFRVRDSGCPTTAQSCDRVAAEGRSHLAVRRSAPLPR